MAEVKSEVVIRVRELVVGFDGTTVLEVRLDLSNVASGMYRIGIRRVQWDWTVNPVVIE